MDLDYKTKAEKLTKSPYTLSDPALFGYTSLKAPECQNVTEDLHKVRQNLKAKNIHEQRICFISV